jgi:hypothetical protein
MKGFYIFDIIDNIVEKDNMGLLSDFLNFLEGQ